MNSNGGMCSRREFLLVTAGAMTWVACGSSNSTGATAAPGDLDLGNVSDLAVGTARVASNNSCAVLRDSAGLYALSLVCTHLGCNIGETGTVTGSGLHCGCHGSRYNANGDVVNGPAQKPLTHFALSVDGTGKLTVHVGQAVDEATRVAV